MKSYLEKELLNVELNTSFIVILFFAHEYPRKMLSCYHVNLVRK